MKTNNKYLHEIDKGKAIQQQRTCKNREPLLVTLQQSVELTKGCINTLQSTE